MPSSDPIRRFRDIIDNIDAIAASRAGLSKDQFLADRDKYDAAERRLSRISEAAVKLGLLAEQLVPDQPWSDIRGIGNWLRHQYQNVGEDLVWQTICEDLPALRIACANAVRELEERPDK